MSEQSKGRRGSTDAATTTNQPRRYQDGPGLPMDGPDLLVFLAGELGAAHQYRLVEADEEWPHGRVDVSGALAYGDNDHVQVSVTRDGNFYRVTDGDGAVRRSALRTTYDEPTETLRVFAEWTARTWNIQFADDEFRISGVWPLDLAECVQRVLFASWSAERWIWQDPASI